MTVVGAAVAMLGPEPRRPRGLEDAALAQAPVGEQGVGHRRERAAQPFADRRLEPLLAALQDGRGHALLEDLAQQVLAAAVLQLERRRHRRGELEQPVIEQRVARFERDPPCSCDRPS
jgi:hypothetical protein